MIKNKTIWTMLKSYGVETKESHSAVRIRYVYGEWFQTDVRTTQDDPSSPLLCILELERVMDWMRQNTWEVISGGTTINNLRLVDGIDLIDKDASSFQRQVELTRIATEPSRLILYPNKTKTVVFRDTNIERENGKRKK